VNRRTFLKCLGVGLTTPVVANALECDRQLKDAKLLASKPPSPSKILIGKDAVIGIAGENLQLGDVVTSNNRIFMKAENN
jgi:hypothetical protein